MVGQIVPCRIPYGLADSMQETFLPIPVVELPVITTDQAFVAFKEYVASKCCWDHEFLNDLRVLDVRLMQNSDQ